MRDILLVSATKLEHHEDTLNGCPIHIIGVGKVQAAINTTRLIDKYKPKIVINFGSCGNLKDHKVGEVLEIGTVYNDFETFGLIDCPPIEFGNSDQFKCFTTDLFYDSSREDYSDSYLQKIKDCNVVDMELYSVAKSCLDAGIFLYCYKWVSDDGNHKSWKENAALGYNNFKTIINERFS